MTAIVGIINRNGVAFAADSAATHTLSSDDEKENKKKITNHANKIFEISKYRPVGVAVCGDLSFFGILWEEVFKIYRAELDKGSFPHLDDYIQSFIQFVKSSILPRFKDEQMGHLNILVIGLKNELVNIAINRLKEQGLVGDVAPLDQVFPIVIEKLNEFIDTYAREEMRNGKDFDGYSLEEFEHYAQETINNVLSDLCGSVHCPENFKSLFTEALFNILISKRHVYLSTTEIVFWGYGEDELFPTCHSIKISAAVDGRIKWTDECVRSASNLPNSSAAITPFAQTDVCNTVVRGVDHNLRLEFGNKALDVLSKFKADLLEKFDEIDAPQDFKDALSSIDVTPYCDLYKKDMNQFIQDNYINKLMNTVSCLMKEDLAEMAESLVRMTCLKRHVTTDDETVGGPVDVAVITKGDGFVWIKRKHYFSADINHHYFQR